jgi:hypothetical protein
MMANAIEARGRSDRRANARSGGWPICETDASHEHGHPRVRAAPELLAAMIQESRVTDTREHDHRNDPNDDHDDVAA